MTSATPARCLLALNTSIALWLIRLVCSSSLFHRSLYFQSGCFSIREFIRFIGAGKSHIRIQCNVLGILLAIFYY
jgi:hypothetical protein